MRYLLDTNICIYCPGMSLDVTLVTNNIREFSRV